ncbi:MAG: gamma-glutamyltransferase [Gemmatimonadales bacterium]|nr:gamma-glutamyltransferase [Gemmatimonadales bacterium]MBT4436820.1 gamma-glutamyltransferase [Gemmatimonadales bacterium]MBT4912671.1 gamma-glutamyltransferase [Gemmatimonadales bacterium]MBT6887359.1 gamma-glutamyltransferase [Gemmatimonadales bacterium]MDG2241248.1 gamma-glutamyltransferase [Longimicrobiales bacterium]
MRFVLALLTIAITSSPAAAQAPADAPVWRPVVMGTYGMVAAEHPLEVMAGWEVLEGGGNAFDAATAVFYMTTVVEQHQAGMGGDAFIVAYVADQDRVVFINGTGGAPALATSEYFRELGGIPDAGPDATDVPGAVGGFDLALKTFGTQSYARVLAPAIRAAREGHPLDFWSSTYHQNNVEKTAPYPSSVGILMPEGRALDRGDVFVQEDLAASMELIAEGGADVFYRGELANAFSDFYEEMGGRLRYADLAAFEPELSDPIMTEFEGLEVYQSAPNSQGIVMLMALNILEGFDLRGMGHNSADYIHVVTEALKLAFADRNQWVADPRFIDVPTQELLSKDYAAARRALIRMDRAMVAPAPGDPRAGMAVLADRTIQYESGTYPIEQTESLPESGETSSFSIADQYGNLVSVTHSVNGSFGSGMYVPGTGIVLNNRMPYYSTDDNDLNVLAQGKRTRHTINPALAMKDGKPFLAWNTPGGDNQPQAMLQSFLAVALFDANVQQAVEAATVTSSAFGASMYPNPVRGMLTMPAVLGDAVSDELAARGHRVEVVPLQQPYRQATSGAGAVKMVMIDPVTGVMYGGVSPAKSDYVLGR